MNQAMRYQALYNKLGYVFADPENLTLALTHRSASKKHNERLEFLGDSVLGMVIAEALFKKFPDQSEGNLTRMRSSLVKGETLAELGKELEIGDLLKLGPGELKSGGFRRASILEDAVEAIIGAIYLESGFETCQTLIQSWFKSRMETLDPNLHLKDDKTRLQEYLQGRKMPLPQYEVVEVTGKDHDQTFVVNCHVQALELKKEGRGNSRRKAEQKAARLVLEKIQNGN